MIEDFVPQLSIKVNGHDLDEDAFDCLTEARAESSVQLPDQVRIWFVDPEFDLYDRNLFAIGDLLEIAITSGTVPKPIASCQITAISVEPGRDRMMMLVITALGSDHVLQRGIELTTYLDRTDSDMVSSIASRCGLQASVAASSVTYPYVMQTTTNRRFLDERADQIGYRWWVDGDTLFFHPKSTVRSSTTLAWGEDLLSLRVATSSAEAAKASTVRAWNPDNQEAIIGTAQSSPTMDRLGTDAAGPRSAANDSRQLASVGRFSARSITDDQSAAKLMADSLCQRAAEAELQLRGVAQGNPSLQAGGTVELEDVGRRLSGTYRLASVEHVYVAAEGYTTRFMSGGQYASGLVDLLGSNQVPHGPWDPHALVIGVVTNIEDPERPSRVKVRFPTFSDEFESAWARVLMPGAGPDRGLQILPEINDEVVVGFEHGDARRPLVLGGVWSKQLAPPLANDVAVKSGAVATRTWKTRAGHSITINDAEAELSDSIVIDLADGKGTFTLGSEEVTLETPVDVTVTTEKNATLKADGDIAIEGQNVTIEAKASLKLKGVDVSASGETSAKVEAPSIDVKGSAKVGIDGGGLAEVKGGLVKIN